jgi:hypothetical protein
MINNGKDKEIECLKEDIINKLWNVIKNVIINIYIKNQKVIG